jgi:acyl-CoA thioesterase-2
MSDPQVPEIPDLARVFELEAHGPDVWVGESPNYSWGRIYGGCVVAQALWAAMQTVQEEHSVHSLHSYFILGGDPVEPVRYEVDRIRNGRSFTTRRVVARQSGGAILNLSCSFQRYEEGEETQDSAFPEVSTPGQGPDAYFDGSGVERVDLDADGSARALSWMRYPIDLGDDARLHACALAYLSDATPMRAISATHPITDDPEAQKRVESVMAASLDHAMWFQRPLQADDWVLFDVHGRGLIRTRGLTTGEVFDQSGQHVATTAQEGLLRIKLRPPDTPEQAGDAAG